MEQSRGDAAEDGPDPIHKGVGPMPGRHGGAEGAGWVHRGARQRAEGQDARGDRQPDDDGGGAAGAPRLDPRRDR